MGNFWDLYFPNTSNLNLKVYFVYLCAYMNMHIFPGKQVVKNLPAMNEVQAGDMGFDPWIGKFPWRRKLQPLWHSSLENPTNSEALAGLVRESKVGLRLSNQEHTYTSMHVGMMVFFILCFYYTINTCSYNEQD